MVQPRGVGAGDGGGKDRVGDEARRQETPLRQRTRDVEVVALEQTGREDADRVTSALVPPCHVAGLGVARLPAPGAHFRDPETQSSGGRSCSSESIAAPPTGERGPWRALYSSLAQLISDAQVTRRFEVWRRESPCLAVAASPRELVAWLTIGGTDLDAKDEVYGALLARTRADRADTQLAHALIWLGLWPGMAAARRRRAHLHQGRPETTLSEFAVRLHEQIARFDPSRCTRIAASLLRSTEREVMSSWRSDCRASQNHESIDLPSFDAAACSTTTEHPRTIRDELEPLRERLSDTETARNWLTEELGHDGELVYRSIILAESQRVTANELGLSYDATRKRVQRALARLRSTVGRIRVPAAP